MTRFLHCIRLILVLPNTQGCNIGIESEVNKLYQDTSIQYKIQDKDTVDYAGFLGN